MASLEYGSVREVWFATLEDPTTKFSFLIRDDAFSKTGVVFGRTQRLGDPISLGPGSGWRQLTWEGGKLQDAWKDEQMFQEGTADPYSFTGKLRMWPGFRAIKKDATRKFDGYALGRGGLGALFTNTNLYFAERNMWNSTGAPSGGFKAYVYDPDAKTVTTLPTTVNTLGGTGYTAICPATDDSSSNEFIYFGTLGGLWVYYLAGDSFTKDTNAPGTNTVQWDSMVSFRDALYYCSDKALYKRTPLPPYGVIGTHTKIKEHKAAHRTIGLAVWQNRLWYGIQYSGNRVSIGTSDGVTAAEAVQMPDEFVLTGLHAHQGALYIFGGKPQAVPGTAALPASIGQVWKYTGSTLTLLWESNDTANNAAIDGKPHLIMKGTSYGNLLAWGHAGYTGTVEERAGLMFYDPDRDAIVEGPEMPQHPAGRATGMTINGVIGWDNTLAVCYHDFHSYTGNFPGVDYPNGVAYWRQPDYSRDDMNAFSKNVFKGASVEYDESTRYQWIKSSVFHGDDDVYNESKVWLSARLNVKVPSSRCRIKVYAITKEGYWRPPRTTGALEDREPDPELNSDGESAAVRTNAAGRPEPLAVAYHVKTIDHTFSNENWRVVEFPLKDEDGNYLQSEKLQYAIVLENTGGFDNAETPMVDSWEALWLVAPQKRFQWRMRAVLEDNQERLDGTANPLDTAADQAAKLEEFWSSRVPFLMYEPNAGGGATGTPIEVLPTADGFNVAQYRLDTSDDEVAQEVSITLIENVTS